MPGATALSARAFNSIVPRRVVTRTGSPAAMPSRRSSDGREARHRLGLDLVEHAGAPGHRAGVPVFELAAGGQHHRVVGVGLLGGRDDRRRHQLGRGRSAVGKPSPKTISLPGLSSASHG